MKVKKLFRVYAYKSSSNILVIELYTSAKEALFRVAKFLEDGYDVIDDFQKQAVKPICVGEVIDNPTEFQLSYYNMVKSGQCNGVYILKGKGNDDELQ